MIASRKIRARGIPPVQLGAPPEYPKPGGDIPPELNEGPGSSSPTAVTRWQSRNGWPDSGCVKGAARKAAARRDPAECRGVELQLRQLTLAYERVRRHHRPDRVDLAGDPGRPRAARHDTLLGDRRDPPPHSAARGAVLHALACAAGRVRVVPEGCRRAARLSARSRQGLLFSCSAREYPGTRGLPAVPFPGPEDVDPVEQAG